MLVCHHVVPKSEADEIDVVPNAHAPPGNATVPTVPLRTRNKLRPAHAARFAHAKLEHVIVRTAPIRLRMLAKLASKLFLHMNGARLISSCEDGGSCKPGECSCENCPKKVTDKGKSACK